MRFPAFLNDSFIYSITQNDAVTRSTMNSAGQEELMLGQYIPLHYHYQMLLDTERMQGFKKAIEYLVPENSRVLELGGGTGVLSFFASARASHVQCIEHNPEMVEAARRFLKTNGVDHKVEVIQADAATYVPPQPVDVVICEMLHSALLREKQVAVIEAFKQNYAKQYPDQMPRFIPEATLLATQLVNQNFCFEGYQAAVPMFFDPTASQESTTQISAPTLYSTFEYAKPIPQRFVSTYEVEAVTSGTVNAVRFITKNILAIVIEENRTIDWHNLYLVMPLLQPFAIQAGEKAVVSFNYEPGASIEALAGSMIVRKA